jgi:hypothetical protein
MSKSYKIRTAPIPPLTERQKKNFWQMVSVAPKDGCWNWEGYISPSGYGQFSIMQKSYKAHRVALVINGVKLIDGYTVDHVCRNRRCVKPTHLRQISFADNILCGESFSAKNKRKTHCPKGHELVRQGWSNRRYCPTCDLAATRKYTAKQRAMKAEWDGIKK